MNHRKLVHPSNKQCRNFLKNGCAFGSDCWYLHGQTSKPEEAFDNFKCNICAKEYKGRDVFMKHKNMWPHVRNLVRVDAHKVAMNAGITTKIPKI